MISDEEKEIDSKQTKRGSATRRCQSSHGRGGGFFPWHGEIFICPVCRKKVINYLSFAPFEMKCPRCRATVTMEKKISD